MVYNIILHFINHILSVWRHLETNTTWKLQVANLTGKCPNWKANQSQTLRVHAGGRLDVSSHTSDASFKCGKCFCMSTHNSNYLLIMSTTSTGSSFPRPSGHAAPPDISRTPSSHLQPFDKHTQIHKHTRTKVYRIPKGFEKQNSLPVGAKICRSHPLLTKYTNRPVLFIRETKIRKLSFKWKFIL